MGIEIVDSIPKLLEKVDVVLLESVDGRIHLAGSHSRDQGGQAAVHRQAGGRLAGRRHRDLRAGEEAQRAVFSSSSPRFSAGHAGAVEGRRGRHDRRRGHLGVVLVLGRHARHVLLRHPRHRAAVHAHGHAAAKRSAACRRRTPTWSPASGRTAASARIAAFAAASGLVRRDRLRHQRHRRSRRAGRRRLRGPVPGDRPVLQDGQAAGQRRRDDRDLRLHGSGRREQAPRRRAGVAGRRAGESQSGSRREAGSEYDTNPMSQLAVAF